MLFYGVKKSFKLLGFKRNQYLIKNILFQKQDVKDTSIQKRLSWNYGQHIPNNELTLQQQRLPNQGRHSGSKCLSSDSMHSSSGVSSTGSLHLSIGSEWEDSTASTGTVVTATHIYRNLSASKEDNGKFSHNYTSV